MNGRRDHKREHHRDGNPANHSDGQRLEHLRTCTQGECQGQHAVKELIPIAAISVPEPKPEQEYRRRFFERAFSFRGLKQLLGAADCSKAGDRHARLAATSESVREASRSILSELTLQHLYDHPLTDDRGQVDSVMRVNYDIDRARFASPDHASTAQR